MDHRNPQPPPYVLLIFHILRLKKNVSSPCGMLQLFGALSLLALYEVKMSSISYLSNTSLSLSKSRNNMSVRLRDL